MVNTLLKTSDSDMWRAKVIGNTINDKYQRANGELFKKLFAIRDAVDNLIDTGVYDKQAINNVVANIAYKEAREQQEKERIKAEQEQLKERLSVLNYYREFYEGISNGDIRHGADKRYSAGSLKVWREFGRYLTDFCKGKHLTFDGIDKKVADGFSKYLENKRGLMSKTITKYVICFRKLCNAAAEEGLNHNAVSLKVWKERKVKDEQMRAATYLNEEELQALYDMPLTGERERTRDMFVLGTLLCQRYSDYMSLYKDNFAEPLEDGTPCCRLVQQKTGSSVVIPFYDDRMETICKKYGYNFPHISDIPLQSFNRYLKDIMKQLSDNVPSLNEMFTTILTAAERRSEQRYREYHDGADLFKRNEKGQPSRPKWDIITGHSARRSGITCLYNKHILTNREIMKISGHSSEIVFEHYIRTGNDEVAMSTARKLKSNHHEAI
ncbi:MAG: site-specific integrase [Prevotella sp.]|nr:site-specific integrase [Prevotella sp.]MCI1281115.1 site-specific integrase [Prevotella sp.]